MIQLLVLALSFLPLSFRVFVFGFLAFVSVVIAFRVVAMVLDAIPFL